MLGNFDLDAVFAARRAEFGDAQMSEMAPESSAETSPVGNEPAQGQDTNAGTGGNPAWQDILNVLPDSLHSVVRPALEKWDRGVQDRFQTVHSQYEPYKALLDAGIPAENVQYALAVLEKIENDPRSIYDALAEHNGWAEQQGQSEENDSEYEPENLPDDPRLLRAEQMSEAVAEYVIQQHEQRQADAEDDALNEHITALKTQHGIAEDDKTAEKFILGLMVAGATAEQAFEDYIALTSNVATRPRANDGAPVVLGGGGVPSTAINRDQIRDPKTRQSLVAQMLEQAQ